MLKADLKGLNSWDIFIFAFALLTLSVLPCLYLFPDFNPYDEKRLMQLLCLVFAGMILGVKLLSSKKSADSPRLPNFAMFGMGVFILLALISLWINGYWHIGIQLLSLYILLLAFFQYSAWTYLQNKELFQKGMLFLVVGYSLFYTLKFFIGYILFLEGSYQLWPGKFSVSTIFGWSNIRFFNHVQTWTLPLLISFSLSLKSRSILSSYMVSALAAIWWCLIIASGGQGTLVAIACSTLLMAFFFRAKSLEWIKYLAASFLLGLAAYYVLFYLPSGSVSKILSDSTKGRLYDWQLIADAIAQQPILGYGPHSLASYSNLPDMVHPHNSLLQIAYEFGIPALIIISGLIGWGIITWLSWNSRESKENKEYYSSSLNIGITVSLCAGLAHSLVSGVMVTPLSQLWFCIIAGWALGIYRNEKSSQNETRYYFKRIYAIALLASSLWMVFILFHDLPKLKEYRQQYIETTEYNGYPPRFWQQGKILNKEDIP